jgi:hypothetical protein
MRRLRRLRPSPALAVATIALLVALGGTSAAAVGLVPRNSVGSSQVIDGSLKSRDFAAGVLPAPTAVFSRSIAGPVAFANTKRPSPPIATLAIPTAGTYLIWAKARFTAADGDFKCSLTAGDRSDTSSASLPPPVAALASVSATLSHLMVQTFDDPGTVDLQCTAAVGSDLAADDITLVAMGIADSSGS